MFFSRPVLQRAFDHPQPFVVSQLFDCFISIIICFHLLFRSFLPPHGSAVRCSDNYVNYSLLLGTQGKITMLRTILPFLSLSWCAFRHLPTIRDNFVLGNKLARTKTNFVRGTPRYQVAEILI